MHYIILDPELAPKTLDAWGQSRSLKFLRFRLGRPPLGYCSLRYKNAFDKTNLFFVI